MKNNSISVLMTSPSLNGLDNVSGIASVVRGILYAVHQKKLDLIINTIQIGRKDKQLRGFNWLLRQLLVPIKFIWCLVKIKPDIVHINGPLSILSVPRDFLLLIIARLFRRKVLLHVHGGEFLHIAPHIKIISTLIRYIISAADIVLVLGEKEADSIFRLYQVPLQNIKIFSNAVSVSEVITKTFGNDKLHIMFMGRFSKEKGIQVLVNALIELKASGVAFDISVYGSGPLESYIIKSLSAEIGDDFFFGGVVNGIEKEKAFMCADVLILPSLWEGLPMVLLEAMSLGVVVVATPVGSITDLIRDGENGVLVVTGCSKSLSNSLQKLSKLKTMQELLPLVEAAFITVKSNYNLSTYVDRLHNIYRSL